jgi:hypothetical protein
VQELDMGTSRGMVYAVVWSTVVLLFIFLFSPLPHARVNAPQIREHQLTDVRPESKGSGTFVIVQESLPVGDDSEVLAAALALLVMNREGKEVKGSVMKTDRAATAEPIEVPVLAKESRVSR